MSKKRSQRKNSNYNYRPGQKAGEDPQALQENSRTKKFSPAARNLLFVDLIFLAVCQMMESGRPAGRRALCVAHPGGPDPAAGGGGHPIPVLAGPQVQDPQGAQELNGL